MAGWMTPMDLSIKMENTISIINTILMVLNGEICTGATQWVATLCIGKDYLQPLRATRWDISSQEAPLSISITALVTAKMPSLLSILHIVNNMGKYNVWHTAPTTAAPTRNMKVIPSLNLLMVLKTSVIPKSFGMPLLLLGTWLFPLTRRWDSTVPQIWRIGSIWVPSEKIMVRNLTNLNVRTSFPSR